MSDVSERLWNAHVGPDTYGDESSARYGTAVLEQYKLYVEMADRISQRRGLTNTFFLTLNTAVFTTIGVFWKERPNSPSWWLVFPLVILLGQCFGWWSLVRSYRLLNSAKFRVIGALEERLPASPYSRAEWTSLGEGDDWRRYWPLTHIERWLPILFGSIYVLGFLGVLLA